MSDSDYDWSTWMNDGDEDGPPIFKFDNIGDKVTGLLTGISTASTKYGERPRLVIATDDGEVIVYAGGAGLQSALGERDPQIGDKVQIEFTATKDTGKGNPLKLYDVKVARPKAAAKAEPVPTPPADDFDDSEPF